MMLSVVRVVFAISIISMMGYLFTSDNWIVGSREIRELFETILIVCCVFLAFYLGFIMLFTVGYYVYTGTTIGFILGLLAVVIICGIVALVTRIL